LQELERNMDIALEKVVMYEEERAKREAEHIRELEAQMQWYESELNLNPFSWGKKKK